ncbi:MAG: glycosyltransferase family 1 protein [Rikenellaceae bacterium]
MTTLFYRKKREGVNSIETVFDSLTSLTSHKRVMLPCEGVSVISIVRNLIFVYKNRGRVNHITGDVHYIALVLGRDTILTIHDIGSALNGGALKRAIIKLFWFTLPALIVRRITVISHFTRDELIAVIPFAKDKISVVHNPFNSLAHYCEGEFNGAKPTILHVGTKSNKNLERVIEALDGISCRLNILGKLSDPQVEMLAQYGIIYDSYYDLPYSEVIKLYEGCDVVSFPSLYEGFGLPILEANAVGRVVIAGDIEVLREVANDSAYYVDPCSVDMIREGFQRVLSDRVLREGLIQKGRVNVERFSEEKISAQYNELYTTIF